MKDYEVVIGLEVHAQLKTKSKIFAPNSTEFENIQNTQSQTQCLHYLKTQNSKKVTNVI